jgi:phosphopantothenoylcysteine decarboxylase/phosphopantothenate--cysteine ligase
MPKRILILSGPTHEYIDPVRFIGNASSGLMGKALAEEAGKRKCEISFISGPVAKDNLPTVGNHLTLVQVVGAEEMLQQAAAHFQSSDIIIFAAAVADYTPIEQRPAKMAKSEEDLLLHLKATPDIAKTLCADKSVNQIAIGFALQTEYG